MCRLSGGFTLIEVIIAITVSAVLAVILVQFFSLHTARSWQPIQNLNQGLSLQGAMDKISSDYRNLLVTEPQPLVRLQQKIVNGSDSNYWHASTNIQVVVNECIEFVGGAGTWTESTTNATCQHTSNAGTSDTLLKVTLSLGDQTLTSIFAR